MSDHKDQQNRFSGSEFFPPPSPFELWLGDDECVYAS